MGEIAVQKKTHMPMLLERYKVRLVKVLNDALLWNNVKLPNNTLELQLKKYCEEVDEAIEAEDDYQHFIEELSDVLISIGGMMRFDEKLAQIMIDAFINDLDKYIFMDVIDYAPFKIKVLYERDYSNGYHHDEVVN